MLYFLHSSIRIPHRIRHFSTRLTRHWQTSRPCSFRPPASTYLIENPFREAGSVNERIGAPCLRKVVEKTDPTQLLQHTAHASYKHQIQYQAPAFFIIPYHQLTYTFAFRLETHPTNEKYLKDSHRSPISYPTLCMTEAHVIGKTDSGIPSNLDF